MPANLTNGQIEWKYNLPKLLEVVADTNNPLVLDL